MQRSEVTVSSGHFFDEDYVPTRVQTLVCLECVLMSVDAGVVPEGEEVIALAGTERGLDTAWVLRASASHNLFHPSKGTRFIQLLAKPGIPTIPDVSIEYLR